MRKILITGANGFVGKALISELIENGFCVRAPLRSIHAKNQLAYLNSSFLETVVIGDIDTHTSWHTILEGVDAVIHLAARVHVMRDSVSNPLEEFRKINTYATERLARQAAELGVKRFIYLSSIKVHGEATKKDKAFAVQDLPNPQDAYAKSKWEAELVLKRIGQKTGMEIVIIRPPLIYGPEVKANFLQLLNLINSPIPIPLKKADNKRSMIYLGNLVSVIVYSLTHPVAANQTYIVSDNETASVAELIQLLGKALNRRPYLIPVPKLLLKIVGGLAGKTAAINRLLSHLLVDINKVKRELAWTPPYSLQDGLSATANWYKTKK